MSKSINNGAERQNLSPMEGKAAGELSDPNYGTILELALPFLPFEETFANVSIVSKGMHGLCLGQLRQHCEKCHPLLLHLAERSNQKSANKEDGKNWLSYGRYRRFVQAESRPPATEEDTQNWVNDYEMILEVSTLEDEPKMLYYDIQSLAYKGEYGPPFVKPFWSVFSSKDNNTMFNPEEGLRVHLLMRRKSTGELANIMNQTAYTECAAIDVTEDEEYESGKRYYYGINHLLPNDHISFEALVIFRVYKTHEGKLVCMCPRFVFLHQDESSQKFHPELLFRAIHTWNWF